MMKMETKLDDLPKDLKNLCEKSLSARMSSYSPYSNFKVGAALLTSENDVITGCNVENASYGLTICAERTTCVKAISQGKKEFKAIAIAADNKDDYVGPCGACRQFMCELNPDLPIYLIRLDNKVKVTDLGKLLPDCFSPKKMDFEFHNGN